MSGGMIWQSVLLWWWEQISALLPSRWRSVGLQGPAALIVAFDDATARESSRFRLLRTDDMLLGEFSADESGVAAARATCTASATTRLRLPHGLLLEKQLVLPAAAERELARILAYEIDRETPFSATELWWSAIVDTRTSNRITVRFVYVPRAAIAHFLVTVEHIGLRPTALDGTTSSGNSGHIALAPTEPRRTDADRRCIQFAAVACLLLTIAAAAIPFGRQTLALRAIDRRIAALRPTLAQADVLRNQIDAGRAARLAEKSAGFDDPLAVLTALTAALPDDAYLDGFRLRNGRLTLNGHARNAAALIDRMSVVPVLRDPKFLSPVTIANGSQAFAIGATVRSAP